MKSQQDRIELVTRPGTPAEGQLPLRVSPGGALQPAGGGQHAHGPGAEGDHCDDDSEQPPAGQPDQSEARRRPAGPTAPSQPGSAPSGSRGSTRTSARRQSTASADWGPSWRTPDVVGPRGTEDNVNAAPSQVIDGKFYFYLRHYNVFHFNTQILTFKGQ